MISNRIKAIAIESVFMLAIALVFCQTALGQAPSNGQPVTLPPSRPVIPPFLNLGRDNPGVLPSYQAFVLPQLEQNQQIKNQIRMMNQNRKLEQTLASEPTLRPTGQGGKFQNTLHFFPAKTARK